MGSPGKRPTDPSKTLADPCLLLDVRKQYVEGTEGSLRSHQDHIAIYWGQANKAAISGVAFGRLTRLCTLMHADRLRGWRYGQCCCWRCCM